MGPHSVREYAASLRPRYRLASRRDKSRLLDEFCGSRRGIGRSPLGCCGTGRSARAVGRDAPGSICARCGPRWSRSGKPATISAPSAWRPFCRTSSRPWSGTTRCGSQRSTAPPSCSFWSTRLGSGCGTLEDRLAQPVHGPTSPAAPSRGADPRRTRSGSYLPSRRPTRPASPRPARW